MGGDGTSTSFGGVISSAGSLTKTGAGTLTLTGANTYSGLTTVAAGTLIASGADALGSGGATVQDGASLVLRGQPLPGAAPFRINGGSLTLAGAGVGGAGALQLDAGDQGYSIFAGAITLAADVTIANVNTGYSELTGPILGAGRTLTLTDAGWFLGLTGDLTAQALIAGNPGGGIALMGASRLTDGLRIVGGLVNNAGALTGSVTVASDAFGQNLGYVDAGGTVRNGTIDGAVTVQGGGQFQNTSLDAIGSATINGSVLVQGGGQFQNWSVGVVGFAVINGTVTVEANGGFGNQLGIINGDVVNFGRFRTEGQINGNVLNAGLFRPFDFATTGIRRFTQTDAGVFDLEGIGIDVPGSVQGVDFTIGSLAGTGLVDLRAATLTTGGDGTDTSFAGVIAGTGRLVKTGAGTLTLTGTNTFSGGVALAQGRLRLASNAAAGTGAITTTGSVISYGNGVTIANPIVLASNATQLEVLGADTATQAGAISETGGARPIEKIGTGTLILTGANAYSGPTTIAAGALQVGAGGTSGTLGTGAVSIGAGASLVFNRSDAITAANAISGAGSLRKLGAGTLILTGANSYSGGTTISGGSLEIRNAGALGTGALTVGAGTSLAIGPGVVFTPGAITSAPDSFIQGSDTLAGVGTLRYAALSWARDGLRDGLAGQLRVEVAGTAQVRLTGTNTFTGGLLVDGASASLRLDSAAAAGGAGNAIALQGGLLSLGADTYANAVAMGAGASRIDIADGTAATLSGVVSGAGSLTKTGAGTLTLAGANTYAGLTTVSAGTLAITNAAALGSTAAGTVVADGATLSLLGPVTVLAEPLTLSGAGVGGLGALRSDAGSTGGINGWGGAIALAADSRINSDRGTLSLGAITGAGATLTLGGAGNLQIDGVIALGTGGLVKDGAGTATLTGANTYSGLTTVAGGTLANVGSLAGDVLANATLTNAGVVGGGSPSARAGARRTSPARRSTAA